jgi:hypothetical protein
VAEVEAAAVVDQAAADRAVVDRAVVDRAAADRALVDQAAVDQAAVDQGLAEVQAPVAREQDPEVQEPVQAVQAVQEPVVPVPAQAPARARLVVVRQLVRGRPDPAPVAPLQASVQ